MQAQVNISVDEIVVSFREKSFEDNKRVMRNRKFKKRQYNGQQKKDKKLNNDLQNTVKKLNIIVVLMMKAKKKPDQLSVNKIHLEIYILIYF